jgi:hypothetical protein
MLSSFLGVLPTLIPPLCALAFILWSKFNPLVVFALDLMSAYRENIRFLSFGWQSFWRHHCNDWYREGLALVSSQQDGWVIWKWKSLVGFCHQHRLVSSFWANYVTSALLSLPWDTNENHLSCLLYNTFYALLGRHKARYTVATNINFFLILRVHYFILKKFCQKYLFSIYLKNSGCRSR